VPGRKWTTEEKANIVLEVLTTSTPLAEICRKYNVQPTQVYRWKASFVQAGTKGLSGKDASTRERLLEQENRRLKEMVADLALANELLKKGRAGT
jgi:putative transposase